MNNKPCQSLDLLAASNPSRFYVLANQTLEHMELYGVWATLRQIVSWLVLKTLELLGLREKAKTARGADCEFSRESTDSFSRATPERSGAFAMPSSLRGFSAKKWESGAIVLASTFGEKCG